MGLCPLRGCTYVCWVTIGSLLVFRKLYWTDGDNISMANMDGSNHTTLFTSQKGPVGEQTPP